MAKNLRTLRTLVALALRAASRPQDRFLGEAGRRLISLSAFLAVGGASYALSPADGRVPLAFAAGWNAAAVAYLALVVAYVARGDARADEELGGGPEAPRSRVIGAAFGRAAGLGVVLVATVAGFVIGSGLFGGEAGLPRVLSALAVIWAWLVVQASYGLHYAYMYYRREPAGGLEFPGEGEPGLVDFCYFACAVGTAFAVSDVRVTRTEVRRVVIGHSLLSFAYNAAILTLAFGTILGSTLG